MGPDFYYQHILTLTELDLVMNDKSYRKKVDKVIAFIKKTANSINKVDRKHRKWTRFKNEYRPANKRYIPKATRKAVFIRDNCSCVKCGATENLHIDHEIALSRGGSNDVDNLEVLCRDCNLRKGAN